ncbi:unnamed protein product [Caenorhabditis sp. 36 PRJEB53466]|nr:unnamed protein product [Caenorhabditis sp. 36 PRJEB53466]
MLNGQPVAEKTGPPEGKPRDWQHNSFLWPVEDNIKREIRFTGGLNNFFQHEALTITKYLETLGKERIQKLAGDLVEQRENLLRKILFGYSQIRGCWKHPSFTEDVALQFIREFLVGNIPQFEYLNFSEQQDWSKYKHWSEDKAYTGTRQNSQNVTELPEQGNWPAEDWLFSNYLFDYHPMSTVQKIEMAREQRILLGAEVPKPEGWNYEEWRESMLKKVTPVLHEENHPSENVLECSFLVEGQTVGYVRVFSVKYTTEMMDFEVPDIQQLIDQTKQMIVLRMKKNSLFGFTWQAVYKSLGPNNAKFIYAVLKRNVDSEITHFEESNSLRKNRPIEDFFEYFNATVHYKHLTPASQFSQLAKPLEMEGSKTNVVQNQQVGPVKFENKPISNIQLNKCDQHVWTYKGQDQDDTRPSNEPHQRQLIRMNNGFERFIIEGKDDIKPKQNVSPGWLNSGAQNQAPQSSVHQKMGFVNGASHRFSTPIPEKVTASPSIPDTEVAAGKVVASTPIPDKEVVANASISDEAVASTTSQNRNVSEDCSNAVKIASGSEELAEERVSAQDQAVFAETAENTLETAAVESIQEVDNTPLVPQMTKTAMKKAKKAAKELLQQQQREAQRIAKHESLVSSTTDSLTSPVTEQPPVPDSEDVEKNETVTPPTDSTAEPHTPSPPDCQPTEATSKTKTKQHKKSKAKNKYAKPIPTEPETVQFKAVQFETVEPESAREEPEQSSSSSFPVDRFVLFTDYNTCENAEIHINGKGSEKNNQEEAEKNIKKVRVEAHLQDMCATLIEYRDDETIDPDFYDLPDISDPHDEGYELLVEDDNFDDFSEEEVKEPVQIKTKRDFPKITLQMAASLSSLTNQQPLNPHNGNYNPSISILKPLKVEDKVEDANALFGHPHNELYVMFAKLKLMAEMKNQGADAFEGKIPGIIKSRVTNFNNAYKFRLRIATAMMYISNVEHVARSNRERNTMRLLYSFINEAVGDSSPTSYGNKVDDLVKDEPFIVGGTWSDKDIIKTGLRYFDKRLNEITTEDCLFTSYNAVKNKLLSVMKEHRVLFNIASQRYNFTGYEAYL